MEIKVRVWCDEDYYNTDCSVHCVPQDNNNGHYDCNQQTGAKVCHPGWQGNDCDVDIDECESHPCQYDGTCNNRENRYTCTCVEGFTGR